METKVEKIEIIENYVDAEFEKKFLERFPLGEKEANHVIEYVDMDHLFPILEKFCLKISLKYLTYSKKTLSLIP